MPGDPFYRSPLWLRLRRAALDRDQHRCVVPGCTARATHVDHIVSRRKGGADALPNLRSLCDRHDRMAKERPDGSRLPPRAHGVDAQGWPTDPARSR